MKDRLQIEFETMNEFMKNGFSNIADIIFELKKQEKDGR